MCWQQTIGISAFFDNRLAAVSAEGSTVSCRYFSVKGNNSICRLRGGGCLFFKVVGVFGFAASLLPGAMLLVIQLTDNDLLNYYSSSVPCTKVLTRAQQTTRRLTMLSVCSTLSFRDPNARLPTVLVPDSCRSLPCTTLQSRNSLYRSGR